MRKIILGVFVLGLVAATLAITFYYFHFMEWVDKPLSGREEKIIVTIRSGQDFNNISKSLNDNGIPVHFIKFKLLARTQGYDKQIQAGEYLLRTNMSPRSILQTFTEGRINLYRLTVPEGYNIEQIAALVEKKGFCTAKEFRDASKNGAHLATLGIPAASFEGYLFPDTYHFPKHATPHLIISTMVARFRSIFTDQWGKTALEEGFTEHEIVTLASIIEKETSVAAERAMIASVFKNRLKKGMRLETDPTVIYGIKNFDGNLTRKHLKTPTPYNTYRIRGLPPGPIACPGRKALEAALYPAKTDYLFFVAKKDGTHHFSTNIRDHNKAVRKYQLK